MNANHNREKWATVADLKKMCEALIEKGAGDYVVTVNCAEYILARKDERPTVSNEDQTVDLGAYC